VKRLLLACLLAAVLAAVTGASSFASAPNAPTGLRGFVHRVDEPVSAGHAFTEMPAFAWQAVRGATGYELQVATSSTFADATLVSTQKTTVPVASVQVQVPWMTGTPYALWAHVRAVGAKGTSSWSAPFGFNTRWLDVPHQLWAPTGLIHWTPIQGATSYQVLFLGIPGHYNVSFSTLTNVADEREYWTFHPGSAASIQWRVRAVRTTATATLANGVPITQYGPYSPVFTSTNPSTSVAAAPLAAADTVSDVVATPAKPVAHALTPGFSWTGSLGADGSAGTGLWRVYVYSDRQCVNQVMASSIVGEPAWAPRNIDPLVLPATLKDLQSAVSGTFLGWGAQPGFMADGNTVTPSESATVGGASATSGSAPGTGTTGTTTSSAPSSGSPSAPNGSSFSTTASSLRAVSLPDNGWPRGRYWWTVVPVAAADMNFDPKTRGADGDKLEYHDTELPQDACAAGHVWPFGVQSAPVTTSAAAPYASGLVNATRLAAATTKRPSFQELPLVTWDPAIGAISYEVQVSRRAYPWKASVRMSAVVPSALLPLTKKSVGTWYYRVRGINPDLPPAAQAMSWSKPVAIRITGDRFVLVK